MDETLRETLFAAESGDRDAFAELERLHLRLDPDEALDCVRGMASIIAHAALDAAAAEQRTVSSCRRHHNPGICADIGRRRSMWHDALLASMAETAKRAISSPEEHGIHVHLSSVNGHSTWPDQESGWYRFEPRHGDSMTANATILAVATKTAGLVIGVDVRPTCHWSEWGPRVAWPSLTPWQKTSKSFAGKLKAWGWSDLLAKERSCALRTDVAHAAPWIEHETARVEEAKNRLVTVHKCHGCGAWIGGRVVELHKAAEVMCQGCQEVVDAIKATID